jgi:CheY-like chemotaxis protein
MKQSMTSPRVLCVDDEPRVLDGIRRILHRFDISTAASGEAALALLEQEEPFAVIVSDMQMPRMNGATLLAEFRKRAPDTCRILLTGHAALDAAVAAVNQGQIFRFLVKPCPPDQLAAALDAAVAHHHLLTAEKVLLEQTLVGSIRALSEVLALVDPEVFGFSMRQHQRARSIADKLGMPEAWCVEVASMLSSVGYAVLPSDVVTKLQIGAALDPLELQMTSQVPAVVERVLSLIPRLENIRALLKDYDSLQLAQTPSPATLLGARVLYAVKSLAALEAREGDTARAIEALRNSGRHRAEVVEALASVCGPRAPEVRALALEEVRDGMTLVADVKAKNGTLLIARGHVVSEQLLQRMRNIHLRMGVMEPILCELPVAG